MPRPYTTRRAPRPTQSPLADFYPEPEIANRPRWGGFQTRPAYDYTRLAARTHFTNVGARHTSPLPATARATRPAIHTGEDAPHDRAR